MLVTYDSELWDNNNKSYHLLNVLSLPDSVLSFDATTTQYVLLSLFYKWGSWGSEGINTARSHTANKQSSKFKPSYVWPQNLYP